MTPGWQELEHDRHRHPGSRESGATPARVSALGYQFGSSEPDSALRDLRDLRDLLGQPVDAKAAG